MNFDQEKLNKAFSLSKQAVEKDKSGEFREALDLYKLTLEYFSFIIKYHHNNALKERLHQKIEEFITRAEEIKLFLNNEKKQIKTSNNEDVKKIHQNNDNTSENNKLMDKLEGAIVTEKPNVFWKDIAGLSMAKSALQEAVILPTRFPSLFTGDRKPWKGILLYGPPGTGKTYLAKACATEADSTFLSVSSSDLMSKWQGESEKLVKNLFTMARDKKPAIIFIDEVDSMCSTRGSGESESSKRIKTEFLVQMQGIGNDTQGILVLGATNVPWELDSAIRRRFERRIYIPLPDEEGRKHMFQLAVSKTPNSLTLKDFDLLAKKTNGFSGADISIMVRDALFQPVRKCRLATHFKNVNKEEKTYFTPCAPDDPDKTKQEMNIMSIPVDDLLPPAVSRQDFVDVVAAARPSVSPQDLKRYTEWTEEFGQEGN